MLVPIEAPPSDPSQKRAAHFSIRDYAFTSRVKDIAVNWPFPTQYLATCMEHKVKDLLPPFDPPPYPVRRFEADDLIFRCSCRRDSSVLAPTKKKLKLKLKLKHKRPTSVSFDNDDDGDDDERKRSSPQELTSNPTTVGVSDSMGSSKICPVCKTFASSSNTTLNAHIDRCLSEDTAAASAASGAVEGGHHSINGGIRSKPIGKHKANPPCKKRSMVEIYASSSCCTLEDLDRRNGTTWALDLGSAGQISSATAETVSKSEIIRPISDNENDGAAVYVDSNGTKVCILSKLNSSKSLDVAGAGSNVHHQQKHSNSKLFRVKFQIDKSGSSYPPPPVVKIKKRRKKKDVSIAKLRRNFQYMHSDPSKKLNDKSVHVTSESRRQREVNLPSSSAKTVRTPRTPPVPEEKEKNAFFFESCFASKKKIRSQRSSTMKKKSFSNLSVSPEKEATTTVSTELYHVVSDEPTTLLDDKDYTETVAGIEQPSAEEDPVVRPPYENGDNKKLISGTEAWVELFASSRPEPAVDDDANDDGKINSTIETTSGGGDIQFRERGFHGSSRVVSCVEIQHKQPREERDREEASGSPASSTISHPSTCSKDHRDSDFETVVGKSPPWPRPIQPPCCCSHIPETSRDSKPVLRLMGKNLMVVNKEDEHHHHHHHHLQQQQQQRQPEIPSSMSFKESSEQRQHHHNNIDPYRRPVGYHHNHNHMYSLNGGRSSGADGCPPYMQISGNRRYFPQNHPTPNMLPVPQDLLMRTQKRSYLPHQNLFYNNNSHRLPGGDGAGVCVGVGGGSPASPMPMMIPMYHPFQLREVSNYSPDNIVSIPTYQYHQHHNHPYEPAPANLPHRRVPHLTPPAYFNSPPSMRH